MSLGATFCSDLKHFRLLLVDAVSKHEELAQFVLCLGRFTSGLSPLESREPSAHGAHFSPRIVAARLNGSLDFFSLETHTSLNHLQFRGEQASSHSPFLSLCISALFQKRCRMPHVILSRRRPSLGIL